MNNEENEGLAFRNLESRELDGVAQQERPRRKRIGQSFRSYAYKNDVNIKEKDCDDNSRYPYPKKYGRERYNHSFGSSRDRWEERFSRDNSERETSSSRVFSSGRETRFYDKHGRPAQGEHFQRNSDYKRGYDRRFSYGKQGYKRQHSDNNYASRTQDYDPSAKYNHQKVLRYKEENIDLSVPIRLNRYLSNAGICSRREADLYIQSGKVSVNGEVVTELGHKVLRTDNVVFNGETVCLEDKVYVLLNKPKDYVTTADDPEGRKTVMDLVKGACPERIYPVGRLDRNTTGVLLLTNDGEMAAKMMHPKSLKKKIYHVYCNKPVSFADMQKILDGIILEDGEIHADRIEYVSDDDRKQIGIEIHSGRNRIVRRIFENLGYKVVKLDRVYFAGLTKKNLRRGHWRFLEEAEVNMLRMGAYE